MENEVLRINIFEKQYELPKDILIYIDEHHCFENYRQELLAYFMDDFCDYQNLPDNAERISYEKFRYYGNLCVQKLIANNIYNATVDELVGKPPKDDTIKSYIESSTNNGIKMFYNAINDSMIEQVNALLTQVNSFMNQAQQAEAERDSKITGTGFGIITNDIVGFGVWAAMENSAIKKQASAANAQFRNDIDIIQNSLENSSKVRLTKYGKEVWLPSLKNSIDVFIISLFNKYIEILTSNGKFDSDALKYIDISKSQSILQNVDTTNNKLGILDAAFLSCPFNPEIYDIATGICNVDEVVNCAKLFGLGEYLKEQYTDICDGIAKDDSNNEEDIREKISTYVYAISLLEEKPIRNIQDKFLSLHQKAVTYRILKVSKSLNGVSDKDIKDFIKSMTDIPLIDLKNVTDEQIQECIVSKIIGTALKNDDPKSYGAVISSTAEDVMPIIKKYLLRVLETEKAYLSKKTEYDKYSQSAKEEISKLTNQIDSLSIFSFSKKKELNARIQELQEHTNKLREDYHLLETTYRNLI